MKQSSLISKIIIAPILVFSLSNVSCFNREPLPEDVDTFIRNFHLNSAMEATNYGKFHEVFSEIDRSGNDTSGHTIDCTFSKEGDGEYDIYAEYRFSGKQKETERDRNITIRKNDSGVYTLEKKYLDEENSEITELSNQDTKDYFNRVFYQTWQAYPAGGLYYGDYFISQIYNIINIVKIDKEHNTIGFEYNNDDRIDGYLASQKVTMNQYGMTVYSMTKLVELTSGYSSTITQTVDYTKTI